MQFSLNSYNCFSIKLADITIITNIFLDKLVRRLDGNSYILPDKLPALLKTRTAIIENYAAVVGIVGSRCIIGEGAHIGLSSCIREDTKIGPYAIVGMRAVVLNDVAEGDIVVGNPARVIGNVDKYKDDKPTKFDRSN